MTDTVQGCEFRLVKRVVLWKLPPTFNPLAQRLGRAARVLQELGECILFVPKAILTGTEALEAPTTHVNNKEPEDNGAADDQAGSAATNNQEEEDVATISSSRPSVRVSLLSDGSKVNLK